MRGGDWLYLTDLHHERQISGEVEMQPTADSPIVSRDYGKKKQTLLSVEVIPNFSRYCLLCPAR